MASVGLTREVVLEKVSGLQTGANSPHEIYEWALALVVSDSFPEWVKDDPLLEKILKDFLNIHKVDLNSTTSQTVLEYYRLCLTGEVSFSEEGMQRYLGQAIPSKTKDPRGQSSAKAKGLETFSHRVIRLYVLTFSLVSLAFNTAMFVHPEYLSFDGYIPARWEIFFKTETGLLMFYALTLLIPPARLCSGVPFYVFFPILTLGMFYYWAVSATIITRLVIHPLFILVFLPFGALPATLALIQVIVAREDRRQLLREEARLKAAQLQTKTSQV